MTTTTIPAFSVVLVSVVCPTSVVPGGPSTDPTDIWFPIPDTVPDVPTAPTPDTNPETIPGNSVATGECFDPDNPDLDQIFNNLLPEEDTDGVPDESLDTGVLLPIDNELIPLRGVLRIVAGIRNYTYDLIPRVTEFAVALKIVPETLFLKEKLQADAGTFAVAGSEISFIKGAIFGSGSFSWSGINADFTYSYPGLRSLSAEPGELELNPSRRNLILSHFDSDFSEEIGLIPGWGTYRQDTNYDPTINTSIKKFGAGSVNFDRDSQTHLYAYLPWSALNDYDSDFLMEAFFYPTSDDLLYTIIGLGDQTGSDGYLVYYYNETIYLYRVSVGSNFGVDVFESSVGSLIDQWAHLAVEQTIDGIRIYVNGQHLINSIGSTPYVPETRLDLRNAVFVGGYGNTPGSTLWTASRGYVDEFRLSEGALYNGSDFAVPSEAYPTVPEAGGKAGFSRRQTMTADSSGITLAGQDAGSLIAIVLPASASTFEIVGQGIVFARPSVRFPVQAGSYAVAGSEIIEVAYVNSTVLTGTSEQVINWPSGTSIGDVGILLIESSAAQSNYGPVYPPFGWTRVAGTPIKNITNLAAPSYLNVFYRTALDTGQAVEITLPNNHYAAALAVYSGVDNTDPVVTSEVIEPGSGSAISFPALSGIIPRTTVLNMAVGGTDSSTSPTLSSVANVDAYWSAAGTVATVATSASDGGFAIIYQGKTRSQNDGLAATTAISNKTTHLLMTLALRPRGWSEPIEALAGDAGSIALNGQLAGLAKGYVAQVLQGVFDLAGQVAAFVYGKIMAGAAGAVSLAGQDAGYSYARRLTGSPGAFTFAGQEASLIGPGLKGDAGAFALSGQAATLKRVLIAGAGSAALSGQVVNLLDPNATAYVAAVETADTQDLEFEVVTAIDTFIKGCKADGIWTAIKASCIMAGARTLAGALTPLVGTAPTNNNFISGDYNRKTGLVGDGSTKYLNSNRANNVDPKDSRHMAAYASQGMGNTSVEVLIGSNTTAVNGVSLIFNNADDALYFHSADNTASSPYGISGFGDVDGFIGHSRSSSTGFTGRFGGSNTSFTSTSEAPDSSNIGIFARTPSSPARFATCRLSFYSIGESLDLALLDNRVTTLMADIAAAIP